MIVILQLFVPAPAGGGVVSEVGDLTLHSCTRDNRLGITSGERGRGSGDGNFVKEVSRMHAFIYWLDKIHYSYLCCFASFIHFFVQILYFLDSDTLRRG